MVKIRGREVNYAVWRWNWSNGIGANDRKKGRFLCWFWQARLRQPNTWEVV